MKLLAGCLLAASLYAAGPANRFYPLPLGSVKPSGWLKQQLRIQADGLSGHLDEFWADVGPNSSWLGGTGEGWERGPYYMDGLLPLAYLLDDPVLVAKARKWVNWTLEHQRPDGSLGPDTNFGKKMDDWWPRMVMLKVLTQYQEVTADERVIPALEKYFAFQASQLDSNPLREWAQYRWGDELLSILWLYNRNGDPKLLDLARRLSRQGFDWTGLFASFPFTEKVAKKDATLKSHGVNNAMALKTAAVWSLVSGDQKDRAASLDMLRVLDEYHGLPNGAFAADEHLAGHDPSQGTELCAVVEEMFSIEQLIAIFGDPRLAGRLERLAFNALPATMSKDLWSHQYDQQPNQVLVSDAKRDWTTNGNQSNLFGLEPNFRCCTANMHQGWPKFAASLWMGTADHGLAAIVYSPTEVRTEIAGTAVHISEQTDFPFGEEITLRIAPEKPITFSLQLSVPAWTTRPIIRVNGLAQRGANPGTFLTLTREWRAGDTVTLHLPMPIAVSHGYRNAAFVNRGPLLFALAVGEKWKKFGDNWEVEPTTPWNYGLLVKSFTTELRRAGAQPFSVDGTPVRIKAQGVRLPDWTLVDNSAGPLPRSPVKVTGAAEAITLIPYGAAKLRITEFPEIER